MKLKLLACALVASAATTAFATLFHGTPRMEAAGMPAAERITGDYLEARTATVFCGACHYNGELMTTGRDAIMAWSFTGGTYQGVSLKGVRAMAAVTAGDNLSLHETPHSAQLVVDTAASSEQAAAVAALLQEKCGRELGAFVSITRAPVSFAHSESGYQAASSGFATMDVSYRTDDGCCRMPGLVWYAPLSPVENRKVGYTEFAQFSGPQGQPWQSAGDDSAIYGAIAF